MARRIVRYSKKLGFTLVELLIVVAIIGVLSTIGVPTFKRMVQKSKKSEAKVNLGGLYTAQQAFFSEYGSFGNQVDRVGFETDGANMIYKIGFPGSTACGDVITPLPNPASPIGTNLTTVYGAYYNDGKSMLGRPGLGGTACTNAITNGPASVLGANNGIVNVYNVSDAGVVAAATDALDPNGFTAAAVGVIAPGINMNSPDAEKTDVWLINNQRQLANSQDGVDGAGARAAAAAPPP